MSQALSNLAENALKYGFKPDGAKELMISLSRAGKLAVVVIADRGPGIAPADRERVTERFARLEQSRTLPGNGLGLSLVRAVAELHGGALVLEDNEPGFAPGWNCRFRKSRRRDRAVFLSFDETPARGVGRPACAGGFALRWLKAKKKMGRRSSRPGRIPAITATANWRKSCGPTLRSAILSARF